MKINFLVLVALMLLIACAPTPASAELSVSIVTPEAVLEFPPNGEAIEVPIGNTVYYIRFDAVRNTNSVPEGQINGFWIKSGDQYPIQLQDGNWYILGSIELYPATAPASGWRAKLHLAPNPLIRWMGPLPPVE